MNSYREVTSNIEKMRELGIEPDNGVMEAFREIRTPHYKVAFIGKFQVGKSHIINKVFLNDENLLAEGVGLCKTAGRYQQKVSARSKASGFCTLYQRCTNCRWTGNTSWQQCMVQ